MADCNSLESLMSALTSEIATLKSRVATLEAEKLDYATKTELANAISEARRFSEFLVENLRRTIESTLKGINDLLATLLGRNSADLEPRVRNLEIKVSGLEFITDTLKRVIEGLQGRLNKLEGIVNDLLSRLSGLENIQGQILMDVKNIYNILSKLQRSIDDLGNQIKLLYAALATAVAAAVAAALVGITAAIASLKALIAAIQAQIAALWAAIRGLSLRPALPGRPGLNGKDGTAGRNGRDGTAGRNGRDGTAGRNGREGTAGRNGREGTAGRNGRDGTAGRNGRDGATGKNGKDGEDAKVEFSTINVPVFSSCKSDGTGANFATQSVQVIKGLEDQVYKEFNEVAKIAAAKCDVKPAVAAIPEHWQVQIGANRPQLIVLFAEVSADGKLGRSRFPVAIPYYNKPEAFRPNFPTYTKGNYMGILLLKDNSRITVNAVSISEAERMIKFFSTLVNSAMLTGAKPKIGPRGGVPINERLVRATSASFFATGRKDMNPTWSISL